MKIDVHFSRQPGVLVWRYRIFPKRRISSSLSFAFSSASLLSIYYLWQSFLWMRPWQVPRQGLSECDREGGERLKPHSSVSSRHSQRAQRGCWEGADPGPRQQGTVTSSPCICSFPPSAASKVPLTAQLRCFTFTHTHTHTHTQRCTCATLNLTPTTRPPRGMLQNPAHSHNPMVRVLAFPDLEHVLPHWDVTSLNTHFLSPCFWFPLWIGWPANNAARKCARSPALITASCPAANPQPPGEHVHPKLRNRASS